MQESALVAEIRPKGWTSPKIYLEIMDYLLYSKRRWCNLSEFAGLATNRQGEVNVPAGMNQEPRDPVEKESTIVSRAP